MSVIFIAFTTILVYNLSHNNKELIRIQRDKQLHKTHTNIILFLAKYNRCNICALTILITHLV